MAEIDLSNVNRLYTVLLLDAGPKHGYRLIKDIGRLTGTEPTTSHIYPFLEQLREEGLVTVEERGDRGKKVYELTEDGEALVHEQVEALGTILQEAIDGELRRCEHCGCTIYSGGYEDDGVLYCCEHCAADAD